MKTSKKLNRLMMSTSPMTVKKWYAGQDRSNDDGKIFTIKLNGVTIQAQNYVKRYSYRWHKECQRYWIDGYQIHHRGTFKAAIRQLGYDC